MSVARKGTALGIVTTSSETAFTQPPEVIYDFVTNPANWTKTYPGSEFVGNLDDLPLQVGDTWDEGGGAREQIYTWHLAIAMRPTLWMFNSVGRLGHRADRSGGMAGRITVQYHFTTPAPDVTLFTRTMTIEAPKDSPMPDGFFRIVNPANIDRYHAAIDAELAGGRHRIGRDGFGELLTFRLDAAGRHAALSARRVPGATRRPASRTAGG